MAEQTPFKPEVLIPDKSGRIPRDLPADGDPLLELIAWLMDRAVRIPGTKITVGLDALLGLVPLGGDLVAALIQSGVVLTAVTKYRVPRAVVARMIANVLIDTAVGAVPLVGDVFDVAFKANTRNLALLKEAQSFQVQGRPMPAAPSRRYLILMAVALGIGLLLLLLGFIALSAWIVKLVWKTGGSS